MEIVSERLLERLRELGEIKKQITNVQNEFSQLKDLQRQLMQSKKREQLRIIKEQELVDIFFNSQQISQKDRQYLEKTSQKVMSYLSPTFHYETENKGKITQISNLYQQFFISLNFNNKAEEIQKIVSSHLCNKYQFLCLLFNLLLDLTRKIFEDFMKQKSLELFERIQEMQKKLKNEQKNNQNQNADPFLQKSLSDQNIIKPLNLKSDDLPFSQQTKQFQQQDKQNQQQKLMKLNSQFQNIIKKQHLVHQQSLIQCKLSPSLILNVKDNFNYKPSQIVFNSPRQSPQHFQILENFQQNYPNKKFNPGNQIQLQQQDVEDVKNKSFRNKQRKTFQINNESRDSSEQETFKQIQEIQDQDQEQQQQNEQINNYSKQNFSRGASTAFLSGGSKSLSRLLQQQTENIFGQQTKGLLKLNQFKQNIINWNENQRTTSFNIILREFYSYFYNEFTQDLKLYSQVIPDMDSYYPLSMKNNMKKIIKEDQIEWIEQNLICLMKQQIQQKNYMPQSTQINYRNNYKSFLMENIQNPIQPFKQENIFSKINLDKTLNELDENNKETLEKIMKRISLEQKKKYYKNLQLQQQNQKKEKKIIQNFTNQNLNKNIQIKQNLQLSQIRFFAFDPSTGKQIDSLLNENSQQQKKKNLQNSITIQSQEKKQPDDKITFTKENNSQNILPQLDKQTPRQNLMSQTATNFQNNITTIQSPSKLLKFQFNNVPLTPQEKPHTAAIKHLDYQKNLIYAKMQIQQEQFKKLISMNPRNIYENQEKSNNEIININSDEMQNQLVQEIKDAQISNNNLQNLNSNIKLTKLLNTDQKIGITPYVFKIYSKKFKSHSEYQINSLQQSSQKSKII